MNLRSRNLATAALVAIALVIIVSRSGGPTSAPGTTSAPVETSTVSPSAIPSPSISAQTGVARAQGRIGHAIEVARLEGLPPDAAPGDIFDIWVAWAPPIAKGPNIQKLVEGVTLERIAPPVTPEGPYVAVLSVTRRDAVDLLYGRKYGALSVTQPASSVGT